MKISRTELAKKFQISTLAVEQLEAEEVILHCAEENGTYYYDDKAISVLKAYFERPGARLPYVTDSLCWSCENAFGGCCWSKKREAVPGWDAYKMTELSYAMPSYIVRKCPLYERDRRWRGAKRKRVCLYTKPDRTKEQPLPKAKAFCEEAFTREDMEQVQQWLGRMHAIYCQIALLLAEKENFQKRIKAVQGEHTALHCSKISAYESKLDALVSDLILAKAEIFDAIKTVEDLTLRNLLILKYLLIRQNGKGYTFDEIAQILGYDRWHVMKNLHKKALFEIYTTQYHRIRRYTDCASQKGTAKNSSKA